MAIETLKHVTEIGDYAVISHGEYLRILFSDMEELEIERIMQENPIVINDKENTITFKIQNGPIKEVGVNGCQVDTLIHAAIKMLSVLDAKFPCKQNKMAINKLEMAIAFLADRKRDREERGVEGLSKP